MAAISDDSRFVCRPVRNNMGSSRVRCKIQPTHSAHMTDCSMTATTKILQLSDGRHLSCLQCGAPGGMPFFYFHGMPGSGYESLLLQQPAKAQNISLIAIDRPGYGLSDICNKRSLMDWPQDVAAVADSLGFERFGIIGISGGGPYALACAHALPERLTSIGIVCGLGPVFDKGLLNEMAFFSRSAFSFEKAFPRLFHAIYGFPLRNLAKYVPRLTVRMLAHHLGGLDRKTLLREDVLSIITKNLTQAFHQGTEAAAQDIHLYQHPWGFELSEVTARVQIWHGTADPMVPASHSVYMAECLPNAFLTLVPDAGHFSLPVLHAETILSCLKEQI